MISFLLLKLLTVAASLFMALAIYVRDPGFRINRLMSGVSMCTAWWAACEVAWTLQSDGEIALWMVRLSSVGWLLAGPIFFDIFTELAERDRSRLLRLRKPVYWLAALGIALYIGTPWCLVGVVEVPWGWGFEFGPLFPLPFVIAAVPPTLVLLSWRRFHPSSGSRGERSFSLVVFGGIVFAVVTASTTDSSLPLMGIQVPPLGSTSIMLMSLVLAAQLRRYGYSLLSAGAFAQEIIEVLHDGVVLLRSNGCVRDCNPAFEQQAGEERQALRDREIGSILNGLPDDLENMHSPVVAEIRTDLAEPIPVLVSKPVLCRAGERTLGAAVVVRDLREVMDIRERLIRSARLAAVGDLSVGIAEEITRPIVLARRSLKTLSKQWSEVRDVARKELRDDMQLGALVDEGDDLISESSVGIERISAIARDVRGFAASAPAERGPVVIEDLVESAIRIARPRARGHVVIEHEVGDVPDLIAVRSELEQVLVNLIVNACHAVGDQGDVRVVAEQRDNLVLLHVSDEGEGIEASILDRIFDPFFTTKPVGEGTGLGLAISYHIVRNHGGEIRVATRQYSGTTFTVELPIE